MLQPEKLENLERKEFLAVRKRQVIEDAVTGMLAVNKPIARIQQVQAVVTEQNGLQVSSKLVSQVMRKDMRMGYRLARTVPLQSNSERCLVLRQQYAMRMLPLLEAGRRIINVDESWLNGTRFLRRTWAPTDAAATFTDKQVAPRISLIAALDTDGRIWCALT